LLYRDDPERYERAAARWIGRLIVERPKIQLSEIELAAAGFREALHSERGVVARASAPMFNVLVAYRCNARVRVL
jgi:hypothetical protein